MKVLRYNSVYLITIFLAYESFLMELVKNEHCYCKNYPIVQDTQQF